jgi:hypothetical protein
LYSRTGRTRDHVLVAA